MSNSFGKQYRLLKTDDYSSVFALKNRRSGMFFQIMRSGDNGLGHARLGLVVGKKTAKRANRRNYMKRVVREWFRCRRNSLPPRDFVVRVTQAFGRSGAAQARGELDRLTEKR